MSKLPLLSWRKVVKALIKAGFQVVRQKGSHLILTKNENIIPVPKHREIKRGLLMEIIAEAGLTKEEFLKLIREK
ncbi:type II toxin-antitoxin system HicA family toxin [Candidatus Bathyarchaeota archaeon]|nr:type II toxin-antitoxin system HicA family toxin [Candidatus Bathyarchaeota archaeon]